MANVFIFWYAKTTITYFYAAFFVGCLRPVVHAALDF